MRAQRKSGAWNFLIGANVMYIGKGDDKVLADIDDGGAYDVNFVGLIGLACDM